VSESGPIARRNLLDEVTDRILRRIREGRLVPGDRLPSTRTLAEEFAVATPTLREALRRLEAIGAVEIRHGSGVYVRSDRPRMILVNPHRSGLDGDSIIELLEARELLEPHLAEAAARQAGTDQLAEVAAALDRAAAVLDGTGAAGERRLHVANMDFHRTIGRVSGNSLLGQMLDSVLDIHDTEQRSVQALYGDRASDHAAHQAILAAIRTRKPARARTLMRDHLREVREVVTRSLGG
jgi:GntR family transcriptional repressor for pyruvate dehydrogenase complex